MQDDPSGCTVVVEVEERKFYHLRAGTYVQVTARGRASSHAQAGPARPCCAGWPSHARAGAGAQPPRVRRACGLQANEGSVEGRAELRNLTGMADQWHASVEWGSKNSNSFSLGWRQPLAIATGSGFLTVSPPSPA
jgi:hypothetical protein